MAKHHFYSKQNGAALVMVIVAFVFISIMATAALMMTQSNTAQVVAQNDGMSSYYIARSGAEATYEALIISSPSKLTQFQTGSSVVTDEITFTEGTANISIQGFNDGSTRRVRITSIGVASGTNISRTSILEFDFHGYGNLKWSR